MADDLIDLDAQRCTADQKATDIRRQRLFEFQVDQEALRRRQEELEELLMADRAGTWPEAVAKATYLIELFANTLVGQEPRRKQLIAQTLEDLARLCDDGEDSS